MFVDTRFKKMNIAGKHSNRSEFHREAVRGKKVVHVEFSSDFRDINKINI